MGEKWYHLRLAIRLVKVSFGARSLVDLPTACLLMGVPGTVCLDWLRWSAQPLESWNLCRLAYCLVRYLAVASHCRALGLLLFIPYPAFSRWLMRILPKRELSGILHSLGFPISFAYALFKLKLQRILGSICRLVGFWCGSLCCDSW